MSIAEKLTQIAENEQKVYDSGYSKAEYDWWVNFTNSGYRQGYLYAFYQMSFEYIRPPFKIIPFEKTSTSNTFSGCRKLKKVEAKYFDFSQIEVIASNSPSDAPYWTFANCNVLEEVEDVGISINIHSYHSTWKRCHKLHTIAIVRSRIDTKWAEAFYQCNELKNLTIEGVIGQNGFNIQSSTKLTHDSLMSIINALADYSEDTSGTTWTITLGSENIAKLTEAELDIIDMKGWVVA